MFTWIIGSTCLSNPFFRAAVLSLLSVLFCSFVTYGCSYILAHAPNWTDRHLPLLLAFGSGALLGDVFLHIIPHLVTSIAESPDDTVIRHHHHHHSHHHHSKLEVAAIAAGLCFLGGILFAHLAEATCRILQFVSASCVIDKPPGDPRSQHDSDQSSTVLSKGIDAKSLKQRLKSDSTSESCHLDKDNIYGMPWWRSSSLVKLFRKPVALTNLLCDLLHNCELWGGALGHHPFGVFVQHACCFLAWAV